MRYKKGVKKMFFSGCMFALFLCGSVMMGCGSKDSIVGTWYSWESDHTISFYEDGTCMDGDGTEIINYKQQEDGTLMFTWGLFGNERVLKRTEDKDRALEEDDDYYYLSKDTFVFYGTEYERQ